MAKKRIEIPVDVATDLQYKSDRTCCVCHKVGDDCQIHHLNEDPKNNDPENLALLCLQCHSDAGKLGGAGRSLTPTLIRRYRDEWYASVRERRALHRSELLKVGETPPSGMVEEQITALAIHDVRNLHREMFLSAEFPDWTHADCIIGKIGSYVFGYTEERDPRVKLEVMTAIEHIASYARQKMPKEVAFHLESVVISSLPYWKQIQEGNFSKVEVETYSYAAQTGHALVYEGAVYLEQFKIVDQGALILWRVLRDGVVGRNDDIKQAAIRHFEWLLTDKRIAPPNHAGKLLVSYRDQAINTPSYQLPEPPPELFRKI